MIKLILTFVGIVLLTSCNSTDTKELENKTINKLDDEIPQLLKDSLLESLNSSEFIVYDSPSFESYKDPKGIIYENKILGRIKKKTPKKIFKENENFLYIRHVYYSIGCYKYLPIIQILNDEMNIELRKIVCFAIYKDENTYKADFVQNACTNNMIMLIAIDKSTYSKLKKVNFNGTASYIIRH